MDPYQELANAIILLAVKDYRAAHRRLRHFPRDRAAESTLRKIKDFFCSGYFSCLTQLDGPALLNRIENELENDTHSFKGGGCP